LYIAIDCWRVGGLGTKTSVAGDCNLGQTDGCAARMPLQCPAVLQANQKGGVMNRVLRLAASCFMVLFLVGTLCLACAGEEEGNVITIGQINDLSGPASSALRWVTVSVEDMVKHINEEDPIEGVTLKSIKYDCKYDPGRDLTGYEWCKARGAEVIVAPITGTSQALKPFAAEDKIPIFCSSPNLAMTEPAGWVFSPIPLTGMATKSLLEWVSAQPGYDDAPKLATVSWNDPAQMERVRGAEEYCQDNPGKFDYIGSAIAPRGAMTWPGEIEQIKDCDLIHVACSGPAAATFIAEFRAKGHTQKIISTYEMWAFQELIEDKVVDKELLDGSWMVSPVGWWGDDAEIWTDAEAQFYAYHPGDAAEVIAGWGTAYINAWVNVILEDILRQTVAETGPDDFTGEALYNTAVNWSKTYQGFEPWTFADGKRYCIRDVKMYEYDADLGTVVSVTDDWLPVIED
jgi:ABC-type branched-subunit amino acid transport system substrate-binding protein